MINKLFIWNSINLLKMIKNYYNILIFNTKIKQIKNKKKSFKNIKNQSFKIKSIKNKN